MDADVKRAVGRARDASNRAKNAAGTLAAGVSKADIARYVSKSRARLVRWGFGGHERGICCGLGPDERISLITDTSSSLVDYLEPLIIEAAPCAVGLVSWSAYPGDFARIVALRDAGHVTALRLIMDRSFRTRGYDKFAAVTSLIDVTEYREMRVHAKIVYIDGGPGKMWAVQSSMNLNGNSRAESLDVTRNDELAGLYREFFDMSFSAVPVGDLSYNDPFDGRHARDSWNADDPAPVVGGW